MTDFLATRGRFKDCKEVRRLGSPQIPPWPNRKTAATGRDNGKKNLNHPITVAKMPSGHIQLANTYPRRGPRDILPVELWAIIKTFIHPSDLLTHVSFFVVTESIADVLYGNPQRQAAFWEALCLSNGLGCVAQDERNEETGAPNVPWGVVAIECAQNAVHCHHPECGLARLRENGMWDCSSSHILNSSLTNAYYSAVECMELIGHKYSSWDEIFRLNMLMNATRGRLQIPDHTCLVNPLLKQIMFEREHEQSAVPSDATEESYLRPYDEETVPSRLCDHPIALRSFATFPPMLGMFFMGEMIPGLGFKACSQLGVTVDSFVREIHKQ
ncbi:hypothetical protein BXZ70DRAFT_16470 [Cristinia sonorae]|uniref:Uncharacterized protein n=1 Tax=Cristinia sonorae TaxID=1940300 RepID=A0A8K0UXU8_9AGAR|nr:hypothetical protein BXZ70DRAFT_16470 [Cristinia sonorae]